MPKRKKLILELIGVLALAGVAAFAGFKLHRHLQPDLQSADSRTAFQQSETAQAGTGLPTFTGLDGAQRSLSEWRGKLLLVNFWASWCAPCLEEIPILITAQEKHRSKGLQIVGPALDRIEPTEQMRDKFNMPYPVFSGMAEVSEAMDALGDTRGALPFTVVISPTGEILERFSGVLTLEQIDGWVNKYLP